MNEQSMNEQIELGKLLQKPRDEEKSEEVEKILQQSIDIKTKISLIKELDDANESEENLKGQYLSRRDFISIPDKTSEEKSASAVFQSDKKAPNQSRELERRRRLLKKHIPSVSYFKYLFSTLPQIKHFEKSTQLIEHGFLGFGLRLSPRVQYWLDDLIHKRVVAPLVKYLCKILEFSWLYLTKEEYNLLVLCLRLCQLICHFDYSSTSFKGKNVIDNFAPIESLFLSLWSKDKIYLDNIDRALDKLFQKNPEKEGVHKKMRKLCHQLLRAEAVKPSLYNIIRAMNIVKSKQILDIPDLISKNPPSVICEECFECSAEVYQKIQEFLIKKEQELVVLVKNYKKVLQTKFYLPRGEGGGIDYEALKYFYESAESVSNFETDNQKLLNFVRDFVHHFLKSFQEMFVRQLHIDEGIRVKIFAPSYFEASFNKLDYLLKRLDKQAINLPMFSYERFSQLASYTKKPTRFEAEVMQDINEIGFLFKDMAKKLIEILQNRIKSETEPSTFQLLTHIQVQKKSFFLPYEHHLILSPAILQGKSVGNALLYLGRLCLIFSAFLYDRELNSLSKQEKKIQGRLSELSEVFRRIASQEEYAKLKEEYDLPVV